MQIQLFQIDAFATEVFRGNPAAVCPLDEWLSDATLQSIAEENNLSETAFFVAREDSAAAASFDLRWFTPTAEVDLCGHATLASAYVINRFVREGVASLTFHSRSGELQVAIEGDAITLDFPARRAKPIDKSSALDEALGVSVGELWQSEGGVVALLDDADAVRSLTPDIGKLKAYQHCVMATAAGNGVDYCYRFFAPFYGVDEDPVTGSANCTLGPLWADRLEKTELSAAQLSRRGGEIAVTVDGERVKMRGRCVLYLRGTIEVPA